MRQCILLAELLVGRSPIVTEEEMHGSPPQWGVIDNKALTLPPCTKFLLKTLLGVGVPGSRRCHSSFLPSAHTAVDVIRAHNNSPLHTHHTDRSSSSYTSGLCVRSIVCNGLSRSLFTCCFSCQCLPLPPFPRYQASPQKRLPPRPVPRTETFSHPHPFYSRTPGAPLPSYLSLIILAALLTQPPCSARLTLSRQIARPAHWMFACSITSEARVAAREGEGRRGKRKRYLSDERVTRRWRTPGAREYKWSMSSAQEPIRCFFLFTVMQ